MHAAWAVLLGACAPDPAAPTEPREPPSASPPAASIPTATQAPTTLPQATNVSVTVLSTSKATVGSGEWGFAALVDVDGTRILFDTGAKRDTVLRNAKAADVDLSTVEQVVLSHHHDDHVGGLMRLRTSVAADSPGALATVHVAGGMFEPRRVGDKTREVNDMVEIHAAFEATGGRFVQHDSPGQIAPGVWVTGPVPRVHPEHNWSGARRITGPQGWVQDELHESQALVVDTPEGLLVISGCGHAGVVNIATHVRQTIREAPLHLLGGFHLHKATPDHLAWTMSSLDELGLHSFFGAHCTGTAAVDKAGTYLPGDRVAEVAVGWTLDLPRAP